MRTIELKTGIRIAVETIPGSDDKPVLVFLHEGLGCIDMWKNFPQELCERVGFSGLVYDRQGYGKSSPLTSRRDPMYLDDYARGELPEVLEQVIPGRTFFLIGHSDGATIALIYGSGGSPLLKGIVTEAAHVFVEPITLAGIFPVLKAFEAGKLKALAKYHGAKTDTIFYAWAHTWLSEPFRTWNIENLLPAISCPVLAIQGIRDQYGTEAQVRAITTQVKNSSLAMIEDCGHSPHLEKRQEVLTLMSEFILKRTGFKTCHD